MTIEILRIRNNAAFLLQDVREFMLKVFASNRMIKNPDAALVEISAKIHLADLGLFLTRDKKGWTGAMLCQLSHTAFSPGCVVLHMYCKGAGKDTRTELVTALYNYATEGGYNEVVAIDTNNKPAGFDKVFAALGKPTILGNVFSFDLEESLL